MSVVLSVLGTVLTLVAGSMVARASVERGKMRWVLYSGVVLLSYLGLVLHRWSFMLEGI